MPGALGLPGGIAASNLNVMHALGDLAVGEGIGWTVLSLLEEERPRPPFLAPHTGYRAYEGNRVAFASALLAHAVRRPLFVFDWIGLAPPPLPLAFARLARTLVFGPGGESLRQ